jgi:hypothetical protein
MKKKPPPEPLPEPNVQLVSYGQYWQLTPSQVAAIACNPVYTGIGPYPPLVDEERWVRAAARQIDHEGPTQFLVNMLFVLRHAFELGDEGLDIAGLPPR